MSKRLQSIVQIPTPSIFVLFEALALISAILNNQEISILADKLAKTAALYV